VSVEVRELDRIPVMVVVDDDFVVLDEMLNQMGADEPGAAGNAHTLAR
jgi:hypothetical protein